MTMSWYERWVTILGKNNIRGKTLGKNNIRGKH
jgi:hypothetical protein